MRHRKRDALEAAALPEIEMVERARAHPYQHLARRERRFRRLLVAKDFWTAVLMEPDCLHEIGDLVSW